MGTLRKISLSLVLLVVSSSIAHADLRSGLIAHYPFDGNADDASGNGHHGTPNGTTPTTDRFGLPNRAFLFDGVDDYVQVADTQALRLSGTDYTIAAWVRQESRDVSWQAGISIKRQGGGNDGWLFGIRGQADPPSLGRIVQQISGGSDPHALSNTEVPLGAWHHVAVVYEQSGSMTFYLDGILDGLTPSMPTPNANTASDLFIGSDSPPTRYHFDGSIDDLRIYDRALSAVEIGYLIGPSVGILYCPGDGIAPHTMCPCANNNDGRMGGCDWGDPAFPGGGALTATGSESMAANDTLLIATGVASNFGVFFGANNQVNGGNGNPLNDGLRCAGGGLIRLIPPTMASGNQMILPAPLQTLDTAAAAGVVRRYQYWFRTPGGPCGGMANLTNGFEIVWLP